MKKRLIALFIALCLAINGLGWFLFSGLFKPVVPTFAEPLSPPNLVDVNPPANSYSATLDTNIVATFDQLISSSTVNSNTFIAHAMQTGMITGEYSINEDDINFEPHFPLKPGELVEMIVTTGTMNLSAEAPISPTVWQFWAESIGGSGTYSMSENTLEADWIRTVSLGDLNQDGALDLFLGIANGESLAGPDEIWLNDGSGNFTDTGQQLGNEQSYTVLGDLDKDGDLDAYVGNFSGDQDIWLNDGDGYFSLEGQISEDWGARGVDLGDLNGDGNLDSFIVHWGGNPSKVWLNDGFATFSDTGQLIGELFTAVKLGDLDGDGDLDAFLGGNGGEVWFNDGSANFNDSGQVLGSKFIEDIDLGDLDNDGDLDAFVCNNFDSGNQVWLNDGAGYFSQTQQLFGDSLTFAVDLGDIDDDGDLDAIVVNNNYDVTDPDQIWLNDGSGQFTAGQNLGAGDTEKWALDLGDIDEDGDLDAVLGTVYDQAEVWLNQNIPISGLIAINDSPTNLGIETTLTATITAGDNVQFQWDFGDESVGGEGSIISHLYPAEGVYTAVVTASNSIGTVTATTIVTITPPIPISGLIASNSSPTLLNEATYLTATITNGSNVSYTWDVGNGTLLEGAEVTYIYPLAGIYTATVTANNGTNTMQAMTRVSITLPTLYLPFITLP